jgi:hypothetical protein
MPWLLLNPPYPVPPLAPAHHIQQYKGPESEGSLASASAPTQAKNITQVAGRHSDAGCCHH